MASPSGVTSRSDTVEETGSSILEAAHKAAAVVRAAPDVSVPVPGLAWSLGETAVHLATETLEYAEVLAANSTRASSSNSPPGPRAPRSVAPC